MDHIECLELENFKSYKGHQLIGPLTKFTAIIGPNGAGKSNLMDAISFVFGIKASSLRGTALQDLIYKFPEGTDMKGVKSYVKLVFVRANGVKIIFQRNINSNGGSEYMIDTSIVKWEQYEAQLAQFNILVKAKNFLVFQGGVEFLARKSPKELTELIEQISGSDEFKTEYERLSSTRDKAVENAQFIFKKQKGMRAEKKEYNDQYKEAERYMTLKEKYARLLLKHIMFQLYYISKDIDVCNLEKGKKRNELEQVQAKQVKGEKVVEQARIELANSQQHLLKIKRNMDTKQSSLDKARLSAIVLQKELEHLVRNQEVSRRSLGALIFAQKRHDEKIKLLESELREIDTEEKRYIEEQERMQIVSEKVTLSEEQLEEWNEIKEKARMKTAADRQVLNQIERQQEIDQSSLKKIFEAQMSDLQNRLEILREEQIKGLEEKREQLSGMMMKVVSEMSEAKEELNVIERENSVARARQLELNELIGEVQKQLKDARISVSESDRRSRMEECISSLRRLFTGVYGQIFDLVHPSAPKYNVALTVVLGNNIDSIVVSDQKTALECIQYMKEQRIGVATFLPLDSIKSIHINDSLRALHPEVKPMVDVLDYEHQYHKAIEYVCGNALVCPDLDIARRLAFGQTQRYKVVTYDGTMIAKSGIMTGGISGVEARARRWNMKEIEKLKKKRDKLLLEQSEVVQKIRNVVYEQELQSSIGKMESTLKNLKFDKELTESRLKKANEDVISVEQAMEKLEPEYERLRDTVKERSEMIEVIGKRVNSVEDELYMSFSRRVGVENIREWEENRRNRSKQQATMELQFKSQRARIENLIQYERQRDEGHNIKELEERIRLDEELYLKKLKDVKEAKELQLVLENDWLELRDEYNGTRKECGESEVNLKTLVKDFEVRQQLCNQIMKQIGVKEAMIEQLKERRHQIYKESVNDEIELPIVEGYDAFPRASQQGVMEIDEGEGQVVQEVTSQDMRKLTSREDGIRIDFTQHLDRKWLNLEGSGEREDQNKQILDEIQLVLVQMDKIAPNMKAFGHLEEVNRKIEGMGEELEEAKLEARNLIREFDEIREKRNDRFMKGFTHISGQIDRIYKNLTNQFGVAHLTLDSNDEPYLHATRFSAVPPYKMYHDIEELSGGEKSIAALALLFAIHSFRPSPFFILDEVDAALDSSNVKIVAEYFKARSEDIQFVLISLKDRCFDHADSLLGVYVDRAQESSKTLTLDLTRYD